MRASPSAHGAGAGCPCCVHRPPAPGASLDPILAATPAVPARAPDGRQPAAARGPVLPRHPGPPPHQAQPRHRGGPVIDRAGTRTAAHLRGAGVSGIRPAGRRGHRHAAGPAQVRRPSLPSAHPPGTAAADHRAAVADHRGDPRRVPAGHVHRRQGATRHRRRPGAGSAVDVRAGGGHPRHLRPVAAGPASASWARSRASSASPQ
jgi:hypothetical protein